MATGGTTMSEDYEYRKAFLVRDFIHLTMQRDCICSDRSALPCLRCEMLARAEDLFPVQYFQVVNDRAFNEVTRGL